MPTASPARVSDYATVERAITFLDRNFRDQPDLERIAAHVGLSPFHFQRLFRRWAGISPKRFLQFLTVDYARGLLERSMPVLDAAFEAGLSGPSRLHDLFLVAEAVRPGDVRRRGRGLVVRFGVHPSPFGPCGLGLTDDGLCWLAFAPRAQDGDTWAAAEIAVRWPLAEAVADRRRTGAVVDRIFAPGDGAGPVPLHLRGTNFQIGIWRALLHIPPACIDSYEGLAGRAGNARAVRATASALAANPVAFLVPCHRVIRKTGPFHGYAYGRVRKRAMLGWEQAHHGEGRP